VVERIIGTLDSRTTGPIAGFPRWEYGSGARRACLGEQALDYEVEKRAGMIFGLFVWECLVRRDEAWTWYDMNLSFNDPNNDPMGKSYWTDD
jgi:hypothetical protein